MLGRLLSKATKEWPNNMYAESVADATSRIEADNHLILIVSRLEADQILSEECQLTKVG